MPNEDWNWDTESVAEHVEALHAFMREVRRDRTRDRITDLLPVIEEKLGRKDVPALRIGEHRTSQVQGTCAIEANPLTMQQCREIRMYGSTPDASPEHLAEVKNCYAAYSLIDDKAIESPWSLDDLLLAHRTLMGGLMDGKLRGAGRLRTYNVRVGSYIAPPHQEVPRLVEELLAETHEWFTSEGDRAHPLVFASQFHFKFETIHPFGDGNGRMGRLWQTFISERYAKCFAWLPVEQAIWKHRMEYYSVLSESRLEDHDMFVAYMLARIDEALDVVLGAED